MKPAKFEEFLNVKRALAAFVVWPVVVKELEIFKRG